MFNPSLYLENYSQEFGKVKKANMPGVMNAASYMSVKKWGSKRVKRIKRIRRSLRSSKGDNNQQKVAWIEKSDGNETPLTVAIQIQEKVQDGIGFKIGNAVLYKSDEERFSQQCTLKLKTFSLYTIILEVNKDKDLIHIDIGGRRYNCFKLFDSPDNTIKKYMFTWSTDNIKPTQRKYRTILPIEIKFEGYEELNFQLSVKFYYSDDVLHFSGKPLNVIDVKAQVGVGQQQQTLFTGISFE